MNNTGLHTQGKRETQLGEKEVLFVKLCITITDKNLLLLINVLKDWTDFRFKKK